MEVGLKLKGNFSKSDGAWGGTVKNAIFQIDGETAGCSRSTPASISPGS